MSWLSSLFSGGKKPSMPSVPTWYEDPMYKNQQDFLGGYSQDILKGNIPDFYKAIGTPISSDIKNNYIQEALAGIIGGDQARAAAQGTGRSGSLGSDTMQSLGNISAQLQFQDYMRAMQGKEDLLGFGAGMAGDVRDSANQNQLNRNNFNLTNFQNQFSVDNYLNQAANSRLANQTKLFGGLVSAAGSGIGGIKGMEGFGGFLGGVGNTLQGMGSFQLPVNDKNTSVKGEEGSVNGLKITPEKLALLKTLIQAGGA